MTRGSVGIVYEAETGATLSRIDRPFAIRRSRGELRIVDPDDNSRIGEVNIGKTRISLRSFEIGKPYIQEWRRGKGSVNAHYR